MWERYTVTSSCVRSPMSGSFYAVMWERYTVTSSCVRSPMSGSFYAVMWERKVDDTFTILDHDHDPAILLDHLIKKHLRIQFTVEIEDQQKLPFLDVSLHNSPNKITFYVYRKPTHTDKYIHYLSNHHPQIKRAIVSTLTRRAKSICDSDHLQTEINHLRTTFINLNGYPKQLVDRTISSTL
ncbi:uncharacterized protein [Haliotis asinina]|uniref:uncharacterized protein n=1 Tax=Haliotis asinina TaxID=109174 RepID=UPI0035322A98